MEKGLKNQARGILLLLLSALSFASATAVTRFVVTGSDVPAIEITFFRFSFGLLVALFLLAREGTWPRSNRWRYVFMRMIFNTLAVILFFSSLEATTVAKANLLNMTYPAFVFIISPFMNRETSSLTTWLFLFLTMIGILMVLSPESSASSLTSLNRGDLLALGSALAASVAISALRQARKFDSSSVILFYLMLGGTIINAFFWKHFVLPRGEILFLVCLATLLSVAGQVLITVGYRYIQAAEGALVSSSRIPFAIILGIIFLGEVPGISVALGAILILVSLAGISRPDIFFFRKNRGKS